MTSKHHELVLIPLHDNLLILGLRQFHESGPELKRTISGHLNEILDPVEPGTRRNIPFFGGVSDPDQPSTRRNIAFFGGHGPAIVQVFFTLNIFLKLETLSTYFFYCFQPEFQSAL